MANTTWSTTDKTGAGAALSGGNLVVTFAATNNAVRSADRVYTGQYYFELTFTTTSNAAVGICLGGSVLSGLASGAAGSLAYLITNNGSNWNNGSSGTALGGTTTSGWICCIAVDATNRLIWARNGASGNWNGSGTANPATGVGGASVASWTGSGAYGLYAFAHGGGGGGVVTANFGDTAFTGTVPSGFASGFTAGAPLITAAVATQVAVEHWFTPIRTRKSTQVALEHWTSVQATFARPSNPTTVLSASRAGVGSVVVR